MDHQVAAPNLISLRYELAHVVAQTEYYERGDDGWDIENAIYAAHKRKEMLVQLRTRSATLRQLIAAYEAADG